MLMTYDHEPLATALRMELQEYGGLLALFEEQQNAILCRDPEQVLATQDAIVAQLKMINALRKQREALVLALSPAGGIAEKVSVRALLPSFAEPVRPLLEALMQEINGLVTRTKRRAKQNQMLLARSSEVSQQISQRLNPESFARPHSARGKIKLLAAEAHVVANQ
jgi:hypothetical protein